MFQPTRQITHVNGYALPTTLPGGRAAPSWYEAFETNTLEANREWLLSEWGKIITPLEGHEECDRCHGRGYTRKDGNVGCIDCGGIGHVPVS